MHQWWEAFMYVIICTRQDIEQTMGVVSWFMEHPRKSIIMMLREL